MPFQVSTTLAIIFLMIVVAAVNLEIIYVLLILGIGAFIYFQIKTMFER